MKYNTYGKPIPSTLLLSLPFSNGMMPVAGTTATKITDSFTDISEVQCKTWKYIQDAEGQIIRNPCYDYLLPLVEFVVGSEGRFRMNANPIETQNINGEFYKEYTLYSIETQLQDINLVDLAVNLGTNYSREYFDENLNPLGIPIQNVRAYIEDASDDISSEDYYELGLLNIIEKEYLAKKGWSIGYVKPSVAALRGRQFDIDTQDVYSFLTQEFAKAYKAKVTFNRFNKTINIYPIADIGKTINVEFSFRNLMNSVTITPQSDTIYTRFRVAGNNDSTSIIYYNFGSEYIEDLNYLISSGVIKNPLKDKYLSYIDYKNSRRDEYAESFRKIRELQAMIDTITDLVPIDEVTSSWNAYSLEELIVEKGKFEQIVIYIESMYLNGEVPLASPDYDTYQSIKLAILPAINEEIERQEAGSVVEYKPFDYSTAWDLYGISELEIKQKNYENQCEILAQSGYNVPWTSESKHTEEAHNRQYEDYLKYQKYIEEIQVRLDDLNAQVEILETELSEAKDLQTQIIVDVDIHNESFGFTSEELLALSILYVDTDFKDPSVEVIDASNFDEVISCAKELYLSAKEQLEIESQPQWTYSIDSDNPYYNEVIAPILENAELGDLLYLELDNNLKTKQRIIKESYELIDQNDISYSIEFSNMTKCYGSADDFRFLLNSSNSSSRNSISKSESNYIQQVANSAASNILVQYLQTGTVGGVVVTPGTGGSGSGFGPGGNISISGLTNSQLVELADKLSGLVEGTLDLDTLDVRYATIEQLNAVSIKTQTIEADLGSFKKVTADDLEAKTASIGILNADIANIHQIFAGNIGSGTVQAFHISGENAVFEDAVIKDAAIDTINANKINAGTLNTNQVTIQSEDGGIQIVDNTQQWTDSDGNVRMQAGRDASGNFNFAVFGTDGETVYIDENGIHDAAVPDGLIVNDMVSDSASINAHKLDIESLFTVINEDDTYTLNSSKIWIDTENQALGAKLTSLTSDVGSLTTEIEATNGRIDTVITETKNTTDELNTKITQTTVTVEEHTTSIQDITTTQQGLSVEISEVRQQSDMINLLVRRDEESSELIMTPEALDAIARDINFSASNALSTIVVGSDGSSLMTQTENGWVYNIGNIKDSVDNYNSYIHIGEYDAAPCIELGQLKNDFKLRITNTEIQFMEGDYKTAYFSNQKLYVEQAEIFNELQFGDFIWKKRHRGNMGLLWIGE